MDFHIITECFVDTKLIKSLVPPTKNSYNHQKAVSMVEKTMKTKFDDEFAVGIIDRDKNELAYLSEFDSVFCHDKPGGKPQIELFKHREKHHYIIVHTNMERWILDCVDEAKIDLKDFG